MRRIPLASICVYILTASEIVFGLDTFAIVERVHSGTAVPGVAEHLQTFRNNNFPRTITNYDEVDVIFKLMPEDEHGSDLFRLDAQTGSLRTVGSLDREQVCTAKPPTGSSMRHDVDPNSVHDCIINLSILLLYQPRTGNKPSYERLKIAIKILDINDNGPRWPTEALRVSFVESKDVLHEQRQSIPLATDPDAGENGTISYELAGLGSEEFKLDYTQPSGPLHIAPVGLLDRENPHYRGEYNLILQAFDHGVPKIRTQISLQVEIKDLNDNSPHFQTSVFRTRDNKKLSESLEVGTPVLHLNATDADIGENGLVRYFFCPCDQSEEAQRVFQIDPDSGIIRIAEKLDYDRGPTSYSFKVVAVDQAPGAYQLTATATVMLEVEDRNDELPVIKTNIINPSSPSQVKNPDPGMLHATIAENSPGNQLIAFVEVTDPDEIDKGHVDCQLLNQPNFKLEPERSDRDRQSYNLVVGRSAYQLSSLSESSVYLDREMTPWQDITISCKDTMGNLAAQKIRVLLTDENDNAPEFTAQVYNFSVRENTPIPASGTQRVIGAVKALDKDEGANARVTYAIHGSSHMYIFDMDPQKGELRLHQSLDREQTPSPDGVYQLLVTATDGSPDPKHTATATIQVTVEDVNDCAPRFEQELYQFSVPEDATGLFVVGNVRAEDPDASSDGESLRYQLVEAMSNRRDEQRLALSKFKVESRTGEILLIDGLDRETVASYSLLITAADGHGKNGERSVSLTGTASVTVLVGDVNDNRPAIELIWTRRSSHNEIRLPLDLNPGSRIAHYNLTDPDEGANGEVSFELKSDVSHSAESIFSVDRTDGSVMLIKNFPTIGTYRFTVEACDHGMPKLCSDASTAQFAVVDSRSELWSPLLDPSGMADDNALRGEEVTRRTFTIVLCMIIICVTLILAGGLVICLYKSRVIHRSSSQPAHPPGSHLTWKEIVLGPQARLRAGDPRAQSGFQSNLHEHTNGMVDDKLQVYYEQAGGMFKERIPTTGDYNVGFVGRGGQAPPEGPYSQMGFYSHLPMNGATAALAKRTSMRPQTAQAETVRASPEYQSLDGLDANGTTMSTAHKANTSRSVMPLFYDAQQMTMNSSGAMGGDRLAYYASSQGVVATLGRRPLQSQAGGIQRNRSHDDLLQTDNASECADLEVAKYSSKTTAKSPAGGNLAKYAYKAYTEGSFV